MTKRKNIYNFSKTINNSDSIVDELTKNMRNLDVYKTRYIEQIINKKTRYSAIVRFVKKYDIKLSSKIDNRTFNLADLIYVVNLIIRPTPKIAEDISNTIKNISEEKPQIIKTKQKENVKFKRDKILFERALLNIDRLTKLSKSKYLSSDKTKESSMFCFIDLTSCLSLLEKNFRTKYPRIPWSLLELKDHFFLSDTDVIVVYKELIEKLNYRHEIKTAYQIEFNMFESTIKGNHSISINNSIRTVKQ